jgi:hypothetical protein
MKPLAIYLVRGIQNSKDIGNKGWQHLIINAKLPMMPNIVAKSSDFLPKKNGKVDKKNFRVYLCPSMGVKKAILTSLDIKKVIILDS